MFSNTLPSRQLATYLAAGLVPLLLQTAAAMGWPMTLAYSALGVMATALVWRYGKGNQHPALGAIQYLFIIVLTALLIPLSAECWPGESGPAVPLFLLGLAAWSTQKGASAAARVGCALFWFVLLACLCIFGAATPQINISWLSPDNGTPAWIPAVMLLIPCGAVSLRQEKGKWHSRLLLPGIGMLVGAVLTAGVLSPAIATSSADPFYRLCRSLTLFGVAQRFEAVISAIMTLGWFCLMTVLLSLAAAGVQTFKPAWSKGSVWAAAATIAAVMLCNLHISGWIMVVLASVFWVLIPVTTQGLGSEKKL